MRPSNNDLKVLWVLNVMLVFSQSLPLRYEFYIRWLMEFQVKIEGDYVHLRQITVFKKKFRILHCTLRRERIKDS
jgi:hypothetical protein